MPLTWCCLFIESWPVRLWWFQEWFRVVFSMCLKGLSNSEIGVVSSCLHFNCYPIWIPSYPTNQQTSQSSLTSKTAGFYKTNTKKNYKTSSKPLHLPQPARSHLRRPWASAVAWGSAWASRARRAERAAAWDEASATSVERRSPDEVKGWKKMSCSNFQIPNPGKTLHFLSFLALSLGHKEESFEVSSF